MNEGLSWSELGWQRYKMSILVEMRNASGGRRGPSRGMGGALLWEEGWDGWRREGIVLVIMQNGEKSTMQKKRWEEKRGGQGRLFHGILL